MGTPKFSLYDIQSTQFGLLKDTLCFVTERLEYYQIKLKEHGVNIADLKSLEEFRKLPFTYPDELKKNPYNFLTADIKDIRFLASSAGTTGPQKIIFKDMNIDMSLNYNDMLMSDKDRKEKAAIINLIGSPSTFLAQYNFIKEKITPVIITIEINPTEILRLLKKLNITIIKTQPSYILHLTDAAEKNNINLRNIGVKTIILSGSLLTTNLRKYIEKRWGAEIYNRFSLIEFGNIATECKRHKGLHINMDRVFAEVLNPTTKEPVAEGDFGVLVLTNLRRYSMSFVRYWTDDIVRFSTEKCSCGSNLPRLWSFGRLNESVTIGNKPLYSAHLYELLKTYDKLSGYFRLVVCPGPANDILDFKIEALDNNSINDDKLIKNIKGAIESLIDNYPTDRPLDVKVKIVPRNSFVELRSGEMAKPKGIIEDERSK